jgi:hypothetical protein
MTPDERAKVIQELQEKVTEVGSWQKADQELMTQILGSLDHMTD